MARILVTGGAGFIGSHVCEALLARGDEVICVDNFNDYYDPCLKEKNIVNALKDEKYKLYRVDILDDVGMREVFEEEKVDKVVHLAAMAGVRYSIENPRKYYEVNVMGTLNLLEICKEFGVKDFVYASSSSVYGERDDWPFRESDESRKQICQYAATKKACEVMCYVYYKLNGMNVNCLRFFTVYGPRGRVDMSPMIFTKKIDSEEEIEIFGDGAARRDFTYVGDIVSGVLGAIDNNKGYEIYNLGRGKVVELKKDFISAVENALGKKAKLKFTNAAAGDVKLTSADISKASRDLGYNPKVDIEEGMKRMVKWYKEGEQTKE